MLWTEFDRRMKPASTEYTQRYTRLQTEFFSEFVQLKVGEEHKMKQIIAEYNHQYSKLSTEYERVRTMHMKECMIPSRDRSIEYNSNPKHHEILVKWNRQYAILFWNAYNSDT